MKIRVFVAAGALALCAASAHAQKSAATYGGYTDVTNIKINQGHFEDYIDWLKREWVPQQEFAKSKGYITGYKVLLNAYPRENEPTLYLLTEYKAVPTPAEQQRMADEFAAQVKMDSHQQDVASEKRGPMRTIGSQIMLQEVILK